MIIRLFYCPNGYPTLPLNKIALSVGYCDPVYFTRLFRKHNGIPPGEYRKRYAEMKG